MTKPKNKRLVEVEKEATTGGESSSTSHDSEGVVVRRSRESIRRASVPTTDVMVITVTEFKAAKNANFLKNKKIQKLFVEYRYYHGQLRKKFLCEK